MRVLSLIALMMSSSAWGEYRVYQYLMKSKGPSAVVSQVDAKPVLSTFPPQTFIAYHGGSKAIDITLMRTWMCQGLTAKRDFCPHPGEATP